MSNPDPRGRAGVEAHDDSLAWLWALVDVLMPGLYIQNTSGGMFIRGTLTEAERVVTAARTAGNKKLTIVDVPYTWI